MPAGRIRATTSTRRGRTLQARNPSQNDSDAKAGDGHFTRAVVALAKRRTVQTAGPVYNAAGMKLVEGGVRVDERLFERLLEHRLAAPIEQLITVADGVSSRQLVERAEALIGAVPFFTRLAQQQGVRQLLLSAIDAVPLPQPVLMQLTLAAELHPQLLERALMTAMLAVHLGAQEAQSRHDLAMLAACGLLHDLGMLHVDPALLTPGTPLGEAQLAQLRAHPQIGALLLERHHEYERAVVRAIHEHHERHDGCGYPRALRGAQISPWGSVLALASVAATFFGGVRDCPQLRLSVLLKLNRGHHPAALAQRLQSLLQPEAPVAQALQALHGGDPIDALIGTCGLLDDWPQMLRTLQMQRAVAHSENRGAIVAAGELLAQLRRHLADAGIVAGQLDALRPEARRDASLAAELAAVAQEAAWQVRTIARHLGGRWKGAESMPQPLSSWLAQAGL